MSEYQFICLKRLPSLETQSDSLHTQQILGTDLA